MGGTPFKAAPIDPITLLLDEAVNKD